MNPPEHFEVAHQYACYRPVAHVSLPEAVRLVRDAIAFCCEHRIARLLVDGTRVTGFGPPNLFERFEMSASFAEAGNGSMRVVLVVDAELIDPERFGVTVARNRGLMVNIFSSESDAVTWLLDPEL